MQTSMITLPWLLCALKVQICKASSSLGVLVLKSWGMALLTVNTSALSGHVLHTCHTTLSFLTLLVQADINTYGFCICTNDAEVTHWGDQREKSLFDCRSLPFTNSTQFKGEAALSTVLWNYLFGNQKFALLCSSDTKITLSPSKMPRNTVALLSRVIIPLLINSKRSVNEDAWTFYLKTCFFSTSEYGKKPKGPWANEVWKRV